jgi:hypothetical protein
MSKRNIDEFLKYAVNYIPNIYEVYVKYLGEETCSYVFKRGTNKGKRCTIYTTTELCSKHQPKKKVSRLHLDIQYIEDETRPSSSNAQELDEDLPEVLDEELELNEEPDEELDEEPNELNEDIEDETNYGSEHFDELVYDSSTELEYVE